MNVYIVDDEEPARRELIWLLEQCDDVVVIGQASSAEEARSKLDQEPDRVDAIFLDIDMPGIGGMRLAELWQDLSESAQPNIVFVTAYEEFAVDAFEVEAIDYLLKPVRLERLQKAVEKLRDRLESSKGTDPEADREPLSRISVEERGEYRVISVEDILYFESEHGAAVAQTDQTRLMTDFSLKFLEANLSSDAFFRCHRSYIVRLDAIERIAPWGAGTYRLILTNGDEKGIPLARSRAPELKSRIPWSANVFD